MGVKWRARLSVLLCLALVFSAVPGMAFADPTMTVTSSVDSGTAKLSSSTGVITITIDTLDTPSEVLWEITGPGGYKASGGDGDCSAFTTIPSTHTISLASLPGAPLAPGTYTLEYEGYDQPFWDKDGRTVSFAVLAPDVLGRTVMSRGK